MTSTLWNENIYHNAFFKIKACRITRGPDLKLMKEQSRFDVRKYLFLQWTIN